MRRRAAHWWGARLATLLGGRMAAWLAAGLAAEQLDSCDHGVGIAHLCGPPFANRWCLVDFLGAHMTPRWALRLRARRGRGLACPTCPSVPALHAFPRSAPPLPHFLKLTPPSRSSQRPTPSAPQTSLLSLSPRLHLPTDFTTHGSCAYGRLLSLSASRFACIHCIAGGFSATQWTSHGKEALRCLSGVSWPYEGWEK